MTKKEINAILNYNFGEFLKEKINDRDISLKDLSAMIGIDYTIISKITATKARKTTFQEFIVIMDALDEDINDFIDYVLDRPDVGKQKRWLVNHMSINELVVLRQLYQFPEKVRNSVMAAIGNLIDCFFNR
ncbi:XRE family transcriptional regulator [bacterium c-19]|nr:XRE family transcriptional regulator [bacterium c-19]